MYTHQFHVLISHSLFTILNLAAIFTLLRLFLSDFSHDPLWPIPVITSSLFILLDLSTAFHKPLHTFKNFFSFSFCSFKSCLTDCSFSVLLGCLFFCYLISNCESAQGLKPITIWKTPSLLIFLFVSSCWNTTSRRLFPTLWRCRNNLNLSQNLQVQYRVLLFFF